MRVKTPVSQLNLRATSPENSATYEHTCPHISLVWESATDLVGKRMSAFLTHQGMLSPHVGTEGCSSFPNSEGRRPGDRGAPYRTLLLPPLLLLLLLPLLQNVSRPASSSAVRVVAARPRVSTKAHFYEAGQWRFRGCRAGRGAPGQGRAGRVRSPLPAPLQLCIWTRGWDRDSRMVQFPPAPLPYQRTTTTPAMPSSGRRGEKVAKKNSHTAGV